MTHKMADFSYFQTKHFSLFVGSRLTFSAGWIQNFTSSEF
jgi:hypothetical protein